MSTYNPEQYIVRSNDGSPLPEGAKFFVIRYDNNAPWGKAARAAMFTFAAHLRGEFASKIYKAITEVESGETTQGKFMVLTEEDVTIAKRWYDAIDEHSRTYLMQYDAALYAKLKNGVGLTRTEAELLRQWVDAVIDLAAGCLGQQDYGLSRRLYRLLKTNTNALPRRVNAKTNNSH